MGSKRRRSVDEMSADRSDRRAPFRWDSSITNQQHRYRLARLLPRLNPEEEARRAAHRRALTARIASERLHNADTAPTTQREAIRVAAQSVNDLEASRNEEGVGGYAFGMDIENQNEEPDDMGDSEGGDGTAANTHRTADCDFGRQGGEELYAMDDDHVWEDNYEEWGLETHEDSGDDGIPVMQPANNGNDSGDGEVCTDRYGDRPLVIRRLTKALGKIVSFQSLFAYLAVSGPDTFAAKQYQWMAAAMQTANSSLSLQTYKTIRSTMSSYLLSKCFPRSEIRFVRDIWKSSNAAAHVQTVDHGKQHPQNCARIVFPSEWAKLDVWTYVTYKEIYKHPRRHTQQFLSIEDAPITFCRDHLLNDTLTLWLSDDHGLFPASCNDEVKFPCDARPRFNNTEVDVREHGWTVCSRINGHGISDSVSVGGRVGPMWCVAHSTANVNIMKKPVDGETMTEYEELAYKLTWKCTRATPRNPRDVGSVRRVHRGRKNRLGRDLIGSHTGQTELHHNEFDEVDVLPGDTCLLIRPIGVVSERPLICLLVASFVSQADGKPAETIYWIDMGDPRNVPNDNTSSCRLHFCASTVVIAIPSCGVARAAAPSFPRSFESSNQGVLDDGIPFVVYRFALYADGFKQHKSLTDSKSVTGCYLLPLGLSAESRRSSVSVRALSISPHGQSSNDVLRTIIDDIVTGTVDGIDGVDPYGRTVKIFLDPVTFFADYPAISAAANVMGHTANVFCPLCGISKRKGGNTSECMYSVEIHSRRLGYMRFDERIDAICAEELTDAFRKKLGIKTFDDEKVAFLPTVYLARELRQRRHRIRRSKNGKNVVSGCFDSHLSTAAVPDHAITGITKILLKLCFKALASDHERKEIELALFDSTASNGLQKETRLLKWDREGKYQGVNNLTMSSLFSILLCAAPIFKRCHSRRIRTSSNSRTFDVLLLPEKLQLFVATAFWWPSALVDGQSTLEKFHYGRGVDFNNILLQYVEKYIVSADKVISMMDPDTTERKEDATERLDTPNGHRILELCAHTIPAFGHARNCSEMVLEMKHQVFKGWLERNTHNDSHLSAVEKSLARDWMTRVISMYKCWSADQPGERTATEAGLRRLFLGPEVSVINGRRDTEKLANEFRERIGLAFRKPVPEMLAACAPSNSALEKSCHWQLATDWKDGRPALYEEGVECLRTRYDNEEIEEHLEVFVKARLVAIDIYGDEGRVYAHNIIRCGDAVSVVTASNGENGVIVAADDGFGVSMVLAVGAILRYRKKESWVVTKRMEKLNCFHAVQSEQVYILKLHEGVRRVGLVHNCVECIIDLGKESIIHSAGTLDGGQFSILKRINGYPPHLG